MQNISGCAVIKSDLYGPVMALLGMSKGCCSGTKNQSEFCLLSQRLECYKVVLVYPIFFFLSEEKKKTTTLLRFILVDNICRYLNFILLFRVLFFFFSFLFHLSKWNKMEIVLYSLIVLMHGVDKATYIISVL